MTKAIDVLAQELEQLREAVKTARRDIRAVEMRARHRANEAAGWRAEIAEIERAIVDLGFSVPPSFMDLDDQ